MTSFTYTAKQLANYKISKELEELLDLHSTYMEQREEVAAKLLENSHPYNSFFNWLGEGNGESKQTLVEALEEQGVAISTTTKSTFAVGKEDAM